MTKDSVKKSNIKTASDVEKMIQDEIVKRIKFHCVFKKGNCVEGLFGLTNKQLANNSMVILEYEALKNANGQANIVRDDAYVIEKMVEDGTIHVMNAKSVDNNRIMSSVTVQATEKFVNDYKFETMKNIMVQNKLNTLEEMKHHFEKSNVKGDQFLSSEITKYGFEVLAERATPVLDVYDKEMNLRS